MNKVELCALSDLPDDRPLLVKIPEHEPLCVYKFGDGAAVSKDSCPHNGALMSQWGEIEGEDAICLWHNCRFDLRTGAASEGPCPRPLQMYPCEIEDGKVYLATGS